MYLNRVKSIVGYCEHSMQFTITYKQLRVHQLYFTKRFVSLFWKNQRVYALNATNEKNITKINIIKYYGVNKLWIFRK